MKVVIGYPPLESPKGIPYLGQNRQFQWALDPWHAYPIVPAYAATLLAKNGHQVAWLDGIAAGQTYAQWLDDLEKFKPDLLVIETKTPVIKLHWQIINSLSSMPFALRTVLVGDHVTALPEESMQNSKVDYILTGGDYDFSLLNLVNHLEKGEKLGPGVWFRLPATSEVGGTRRRRGDTSEVNIRNTGKFKLSHRLDDLPFIDRDLTKWELYAYQNSNYSRVPGTYTMFGRDCWWGRCTFCSWTTLFPGRAYRVMSPKRALDEIGHVLENYPVREIMDDSGTFPTGDWMREFCAGMIKRGYHKKIKLDCNMRFHTDLTKKDYELMGKAGFRFLLYGLESANQKTLDRINKNSTVGVIKPVLKMAKEAGLWPHLTVMVGYPWETRRQAEKTLDFARRIFKEGLADTLQATVVIPYPGTPLFAECERAGWLKTKDWSRYDMKAPVMKTEMKDEELMGLVRGLYAAAVSSPEFIGRKLKEGFTDLDKFRYYIWSGLKYFSRMMDFRQGKASDKCIANRAEDFVWKGGRTVFGALAKLARGGYFN